MKINLSLIGLSFFVFSVFTFFSYTVSKEAYTQIDFNTTVKLQDRIPRNWDQTFSFFSLAGSAEVTVIVCIIFALVAFLRFKILAVLGWSLIVPATIVEIFGKLFLLHPGPPKFLHRTLVETHLPSFYIHTDFSYPSGHMTRSMFLVTIFCILIATSKTSLAVKILVNLGLLIFAGFMFVTRIYLGEHWFSDVLGGALLGLSFGIMAVALILPFKKLHKG